MPDSTPTPGNPEPPSRLKLLRVVGPPGAGKSYLITLLIEELRPLGHFVATSAPRSEGVTVITTSSGARITVEKLMSSDELTRLTGSIDPRATLLLAESLDAPGHPAIEVVPADEHSINTEPSDLLATVRTSELAPGALAPLATLIPQRLLGAAPPDTQPRGLLSRLFRGKK